MVDLSGYSLSFPSTYIQLCLEPTDTQQQRMTKATPSKRRNPLLSSDNLKLLFYKQPWCFHTLKALNEALDRKLTKKNANEQKIKLK